MITSNLIIHYLLLLTSVVQRNLQSIWLVLLGVNVMVDIVKHIVANLRWTTASIMYFFYMRYLIPLDQALLVCSHTIVLPIITHRLNHWSPVHPTVSLNQPWWIWPETFVFGNLQMIEINNSVSESRDCLISIHATYMGLCIHAIVIRAVFCSMMPDPM